MQDLQTVLEQGLSDVNEANKYGNTALHALAGSGDYEGVNLLLRVRALARDSLDVTVRDARR